MRWEFFSGKSGSYVCCEKGQSFNRWEISSGNLIASDVPAILKYTKTVCYIDDREIAEIKADGIRFYDIDQEELQKEFKTVEWDAKAAEKEGFEHFMLKEIYEQPKAVADTISPRIKNGKIVIDELK